MVDLRRRRLRASSHEIRAPNPEAVESCDEGTKTVAVDPLRPSISGESNPSRTEPRSSNGSSLVDARIRQSARHAFVAGPSSTAQVYRDLEEFHHGDVVDPASFPATLGYLNGMLAKLVEQLEQHPDDYPGIDPNFSAEIALLDTKTVNAFAAVVGDRTKKLMTDEVIIMTTGLIGEFLHADAPAHFGIEERLLAIVGVMAHELAHTIDKADPEGIEQAHGRANNNGSSVAIELRTDYEAQKLLRHAGLPMNALYYAQQITGHNTDNLERASALMSSHPEVTFRSAFQRGAMTSTRIHFGASAPVPPVPLQEANAIAAEVKTIRQATKFELPSYMGELNEVIGKLNGKPTRAEFNACVLWFDHQLAKDPNIDIADPLLNSIRRKIMRHSRSLATSTDELESLLATTDIDGLEDLPRRTHADFVRALPFYADPKLLDGDPPIFESKIDQDVATLQTDVFLKPKTRYTRGTGVGSLYDVHDVPRYAHDVSLGYAPEIAASVVDVLCQDDPVELEGVLGYMLEKQGYDATPLEPADFVACATKFHERAIGPLVEQTKLLDERSPLYLFDYAYAVPTKKSRGYWQDLLAKNASHHAAGDALEVLEQIYENRGMWTTLEFMTCRDFQIDWDLIGSRLGIPRDQLNHELLKSFKESIGAKIAAEATCEKPSSPALPNFPRPRPSWLPANQDNFLREQIDALPTAEQRSHAKWGVLARYYKFFPANRAQKLSQAFGAALDAEPPTTLDAIYQTWNASVEKVLGRSSTNDVDFPAEKVATVWTALDSSGVSQSLKETFVDELFESTPFAYLSKFDTPNTRAVYHAFCDVGRAEYLPDFFEAIRTNQVERWSSNPEAYAGYAERAVKRSIVKLTDDVLEEVPQVLAGASNAKALDYLSRTTDLFAFAFERNEYNVSRELTEHFIQDLERRDLTGVERLDAFRDLTRFAVNFDTDAYFESQIFGHISDDFELIRTLLEEGRIKSSQLQIDLARMVLEGAHADASPEILVEKLDEMVPKASNAKDDFLEDLAWTHDLSGDRLKVLIEDNKSTNWRRHDPQPLMFNGMFTEAIKALTPEKKSRLVSYLINGASEEAILDEIISGIKSDIDGRFARGFAIAKHNGLGALNEDVVDEQLEQARTAIVTMVNESDPIQRVPLVEYLLTTGERSVASDPSMMRDILERHLGLATGSPEHAILQAYLDVIPEHERDLTLSYLLVNGRAEGSNTINLRPLFEVFGTAGIKFGQLAAIWNVFGEEHREQLEGLFDSAAPMSKHEIEGILKRELGDTYDDKVARVVRVLGSAGIKTVVLVQLKDGEQVAVGIKRPNADGQTRTNLDFARRFLERLDAYALQSNNPIFGPLVEAVERQMPEELDLLNEAEKTTAAKTMIDEIAQTFPADTGWNLAAASMSDAIPTSENIFSTHAVPGVSAREFFADDDISQEEKDRVGGMMTKASLAMLFDYGRFDPDRHPGNWLIDRETNTIHFIDAGQLTRFPTDHSALRPDGRLAIAQFLAAIDGKRGADIVRRAKALRKDDDRTIIDEAAVAKQIDAAIREAEQDPAADESELLKAIVTLLYGSGMELDEMYTFGAFKGLLVLSGSGYVSKEDFAAILGDQVRGLYRRKAPAVFAPRLAGVAAKVIDRLHGRTD